MPSSEKVLNIDHLTCDGRSNKVPKKDHNDAEAYCSLLTKPDPAEDGGWKCNKAGSKCFLKCYNGYVATRKSMLLCDITTDPSSGQIVSKEWKVAKGPNACYNTKNCDGMDVPNAENYLPGTFSCEQGKSCNFQCGTGSDAIQVSTARKCEKGQWINSTGQKKGRESELQDVACCINAVKPAAAENGDFTSFCRKDKVGGEICYLTCNNGAKHNKHFRGRIECIGNQWVESGFNSCDQVAIKEYLNANRALYYGYDSNVTDLYDNYGESKFENGGNYDIPLF